MSLTPPSGTDAGTTPEDWPAPGELHIKERRAWRTWQLVVVGLVALVVGAWVNSFAGPSGNANSQAAEAPAYKLPASAGATTTTRLRPVDHQPPRRRPPRQLLHHDDFCRGRVDNDDVVFDIIDGRRRTCTRAPGSNPAEGQLDQPHVHDDRCGLEHRLGLQLCTGASLGALVAGIRDAGRVVTHGNARNQRDRAIGTVGHRADQSRRPNVGGAGPRHLHLGREGHRLLAIPRRRQARARSSVGPVCAGGNGSYRSAFSGVGFRVPQTGQFDVELIEEVVVSISRFIRLRVAVLCVRE